MYQFYSVEYEIYTTPGQVWDLRASVVKDLWTEISSSYDQEEADRIENFPGPLLHNHISP
jgi:hypothetical protein